MKSVVKTECHEKSMFLTFSVIGKNSSSGYVYTTVNCEWIDSFIIAVSKLDSPMLNSVVLENGELSIKNSY